MISIQKNATPTLISSLPIRTEEKRIHSLLFVVGRMPMIVGKISELLQRFHISDKGHSDF